jgi:excisionase family DNA binding protein
MDPVRKSVSSGTGRGIAGVETAMTAMISTEPPVTSARLLMPGEVAAAFRVDVRTVNRWANAGQLPSVRTRGGHHRFHLAEVLAALRG